MKAFALIALLMTAAPKPGGLVWTTPVYECPDPGPSKPICLDCFCRQFIEQGDAGWALKDHIPRASTLLATTPDRWLTTDGVAIAAKWLTPACDGGEWCNPAPGELSFGARPRDKTMSWRSSNYRELAFTSAKTDGGRAVYCVVQADAGTACLTWFGVSAGTVSSF